MMPGTTYFSLVPPSSADSSRNIACPHRLPDLNIGMFVLGYGDGGSGA